MVFWIVVAVVSSVAALALLVLWLAERARRVRLARSREETEWDRLDRELELAEQAGRFRIVADLGDVAVQAVSRLVSQAESIRYTAADSPTASRASSELADSAKEALGELRRLQSVAREGGAAGLAPSLHSVRDLFAELRDRGLSVAFAERGERFELRPGAEVAVLRILQTSLENSLKHGGSGTTAAVTFAWTDVGLQVSVDDDGIRAAARRSGLDRAGVDEATAYGIADDVEALIAEFEGEGLAELRHRAEVFGGTVNARAVPGVGFSVSAVFPALRHHNGVHGVDLTR
ncbi:sensor histidine kinase [Leifsonia sp. AG29]|uniref:sensor histidine kinase n=1 Tax=Leifsonia sp. AG29 TaxID=2598860 RepID=UPI00131D67DC|nr:ATP-binding protein [Leifsonia sp. AG29]